MTLPYIYQPLQDPLHEIRLLTILPGEAPQAICVELTTAARESSRNDYDAISYTWGKSQTGHEIFISGKAIQVRQNPWLLLQQLRRTNITQRKIWIDAICIDQSSIEEKEAQVSSIGQTFRNAVSVLVWLNQTSLHDVLQQEIFDLFTYENATSPSNTLGQILDQYLDTQIIKDGILKLVYHVYWTRVWIVQELALAQNAQFIYGSRLTSSDLVANMKIWCWANGSEFDDWIEGLEKDRDFYAYSDIDPNVISSAYWSSTMPRLRYLLASYGLQECQDLRDIIYGLPSLTDDSFMPEIDYSVSIAELFVRTLRCIERSPDCVSHGQFDGESASVLSRALGLERQLLLSGMSELERQIVGVNYTQTFEVRVWPRGLIAKVSESSVASTPDKYTSRTRFSRIDGVTYCVYDVNQQTPSFDYLQVPNNIERLTCGLYCHLGSGKSSLILGWNSASKQIKIRYVIGDRGIYANGTYRLNEEPEPLLLSSQLLSSIEFQLNSTLNVERMWFGQLEQIALQLSVLDMLHYGAAMEYAVDSGIGWHCF